MPHLVEPVERGTFRVASASVAGYAHLVDVTAYGGAGKCDCEDFRCRHEPVISACPPGSLAAPPRCRHIVAAREFIADCVVTDWLRSEPGDGP